VTETGQDSGIGRNFTAKHLLPPKESVMAAFDLQAFHLSKSYTVDKRFITVLDDISLSVSCSEFLVIEGESGSGKSTLLSLLSGLDKPDSGRIVLAETDITDLDEDALAPFRNRTIGYVFQSFHLVPSLTAQENVMFPAELNGDRLAENKARELLDKVGLSHRRQNFPHQLSGGEKQRVAICRAMINKPKILFADEPTGNLDSINGATILQLLLQLKKRHETTLVLATHSSEIAAKADRIVRLADGVVQNR